MLKVRRLAEGFYALEDARVRQFLVLGEEGAMLFDTGFGDTEVLAAARTLTDLPIDLVLTHGDPDHVGGLGDFTSCRLHPGDWHKITAPVSLTPLAEGDVLRCGRFAFEVIAIPGHTPGSVAFYDRVQKILLPGDSVQQGGPIDASFIARDLADARALRDGKLASEAHPALPCRLYHGEAVDFLYDGGER